MQRAIITFSQSIPESRILFVFSVSHEHDSQITERRKAGMLSFGVENFKTSTSARVRKLGDEDIKHQGHPKVEF